MKKHLLRISALIAVFSCLHVANAQSDLILTAVFDGNLPGQLPKGIELYAVEDIPDMSIYGIGSANNGGGTDGIEFTFPADSYPAGSYIYVASEAPQFTAFFGFAPDYTTNAVNINGDDAIELFMGGFEQDVYGEIEFESMDASWEYLNGWAYRVDGTGPDGTDFIIENWIISGINALAGVPTNSEADLPIPVGTYSPEEVDVPVLAFETTALVVEENEGSLDVSVTITNPNENATSVEVVLSGGTAVNGVDFEFTSPELVVFPAGSFESQTISIEIFDNDTEDGDRTIELTLQNPDNEAIIGFGEVVITIADDDATIPFYEIITLRVNDEDGVPQLLEEYGEIRGVVHGVNLRPDGLEFTLIDPTAGIGVFRPSGNLGYEVEEGDSLRILGTVSFFNGLTQFEADSIEVIATGLTPYSPETVTELNEDTESQVVRLECVALVDETQWTGEGNGFNVEVANPSGTFTLRIDNDVDLYNETAPEGLFHISGIGSQFDNESPYDDGYQLVPRYLADITSAGEECITSVPDKKKSTILVYPNPVIDQLTLATNEKIHEIRIADFTGKTIRRFSENNSGTVNLNLGDLSSGIYLIEIFTESGRMVREIVKP